VVFTKTNGLASQELVVLTVCGRERVSGPRLPLSGDEPLAVHRRIPGFYVPIRQKSDTEELRTALREAKERLLELRRATGLSEEKVVGGEILDQLHDPYRGRIGGLRVTLALFLGANILTGDQDFFSCGVDHARVDRTNIRTCFVRHRAVQLTLAGINQRSREMADTVRNSRLEVRVAKNEKDAIERAAALSGSSTTDFVRSTMLMASERAVRAHEVLRLTSEGAAAFVEAITNPPEPNEDLRALAREAREIPGQVKV
jgi:uncharacterized protein (DUF1778 family)